MPADVLRKLQHVVLRACCVQNTCRQTFCASYSMLYYVPAESKTLAGRRFAQVTACCSMGLLCPKHLPADVLRKLQHVVVWACCVQNTCRQTFCASYSMLYYVPVVSKTPAGRRFAQVTACCSMGLLCPKHLQADVLRKLQHVVACACCAQNTCRQTFCASYSML